MTSHTFRQFRSAFAGLCIVFGLPAIAFAQASKMNPGSATFSVAGGLNVARITVPELPFDELEGIIDFPEVSASHGSRIGFLGGVVADFAMTQRTSFMTGALVSTRGGKVEVSIEGAPGTSNVSFQMMYLDVPLLVSGRVMGIPDCSLSILGGGMAGIRLHARSRVTLLGQSESRTFTDVLPVFDFGLTIGARFDRGRGYIASYYTHGLTDTGDADEPIKHRVWSTIAGWKF